MALIVIAFFLLGAFFVLRGEGLFILVLTAFVLLWTLHVRTLPPVESEPGGDQPIVVALGDSFIAGQGAFEFHAANNSIGAEGESSCRRSPSAFPELVFAGAAAGPAAGEWDVINLACSGAKIDDVGSRAQHSSGPGSSSQLDQLDALSEETKQRIGLVLLTIGGNDSGFATVAQACLLPADCSTRESFWLQRANRLGPPQEGAGPEGGRSPLEELFASVQQRMATIATEAGGSPAPVVVVPYPQVLDEVDCRLAIGEAERDFVVRFERVLNGAIVRAALATQGVYPFPGAFGAYRQSVADDGMREGRLLCDETPGVNFIHLRPHEGSVVGRLDPVHWKDGSLHPRLEGHQRMAEVLRPWLEDGLASVGAGSPFASYDDTDFADLCQTFAVDAAMALDAAAAGEADAGGAEPAGTEPAGGTDEGELAATGGAEPVDASCAEPISIITPEDDMSSSDELDAESAWITDQLRGTSQRVAMPLAALVASGALLSLALHAVAGRPLRWLFPQARPVAAGEEASGQEPDEPASARPQT
jgi:lysophospholipase L1-like esterase